jgi:hypothetical protein
MLTFLSPYEMALTKAAQRRIWEQFLERGTSHSGNAATLPYILRRCEQERIAYTLEAMPGVGYYVKRGVRGDSK